LAADTDNGAVKFVLEVELTESADPRAELGRILRYWGGAMKQLDGLAPGQRQDIYDSGYAKVGSWAVTT
jgi:aminoglycoside phosphotransferase (APT) family kinase protein